MESLKNWLIKKLGGVTGDEARRAHDSWDRYAKGLEDAAQAGNALVVTTGVENEVIPKGTMVFLKTGAYLRNCRLCDSKLWFRPGAGKILVEGCLFEVEKNKSAIDINL